MKTEESQIARKDTAIGILLLCAVFLPVIGYVGFGVCKSGGDTYWTREREAITEDKAPKIAEHAARIASIHSLSLGGFNQRWDRVIRAAHEQAEELYCREIMVERLRAGPPYGRTTGRWRYVGEETVHEGYND